jgi:hypothetical protein
MADEITPNTQTPQTEAPIEPIPEPIETVILSEPEVTVIETEPTAQIPVSEPLTTSTMEAEPAVEIIPEVKPVETTPEELLLSATLPEEKPLASSESKVEEVKPEISESIKTESKPVEIIPETKSEPKQETKSDPKPEPEQPKIIPVIITKKNIARELLVKARSAIQFRKRKKLEKVMSLFLKKQKITNDEVEKFMHVSDATATRYLSQLKKEGKIKQSGKTGKSVFYSKI